MTIKTSRFQTMWPYALSVPLILLAYATGLFFRGTDSIWFLPSLLSLLGFSFLALWPGLKRGWDLPKAPVIYFILAFGGYLWLSTLWSSVPYNSMIFAFILSVLPFFSLVLVLMPRPYEALKIYGIALTLAACILAIWALIQYFFILKEGGGRIHHPLLNPNNLAVMMNMGLFPLLALFFIAKKRSIMVLAFILALLMLSGLIVTQSRGALLSGLIAFFVLILSCDKAGGFHWKHMVAFIIGAVGIYLFIDNYQFGLGALHAGSMPGAVSSMEGRHIVWLSTWNLILERPWLGTGLGSFAYYYPAHRLPTDQTDGFFVHMDPLQFWQEAGLAAPLLFYAVLSAILWRTIRAMRAVPRESALRLEIMAPFCGLLALVLHTHITFHLYLLITLIPAAVLLSYWFLATERALKESRICFKPSGKTYYAFLIGLVLVHVLSALWLVRAGASLQILSKAAPILAHGDLEEGKTLINWARRISPDKNWRPYEYEARYNYALLQKKGAPKSIAQRKILYANAQEALDKAIDRNPVLSHLYNLRALLYFSVGGDIEPEGEAKAIATLKKTLTLNPLALDARLGLAQIYEGQGQAAQALQILEEGLGWSMPRSRTTLNYYVKIARARKANGDQAGYDKALKLATGFAKKYGLTSPAP